MVRRRPLKPTPQSEYANGLWLPPRGMLLPRSQNKHSPGCCGCGGVSCSLFSDTFTRADSSSIGAAYTEQIGLWEIISNSLRVTSSLLPAIVTSASAPSQQNISIQVNFENAASGTKIRAIWGYTNTSNYYFAELYIHGSAGYVKLYHRSGGSDTLLSTSMTSDTLSRTRLTICYDGNILGANADTHWTYTSTIVSAPGGTELYGIGVVNPVTTSGVRFTSIYVTKAESGCDICHPGNCCAVKATPPNSGIHCIFDDFGPPQTLQLDITGFFDGGGGDCSWCGGEPMVGSWVVQNQNSTEIFPCINSAGPCSFGYEEAVNFPSDPCQGSRELCIIHHFVNISWNVVYSSYRIDVRFYTRAPAFGETCASQPCGYLDGFFPYWTKVVPWTAPINRTSLVAVDVPLDIGPSNCSYTSPTCTIDFLT